MRLRAFDFTTFLANGLWFKFGPFDFKSFFLSSALVLMAKTPKMERNKVIPQILDEYL